MGPSSSRTAESPLSATPHSFVIGIRKPKIHDAGNSVILPGLVNAHTHLELSDCQRGPPPKDGFASWLVRMLQRTRIDPVAMEQAVKNAIAIGIEQSLRFGVTTVGDISRQCRVTRPLLARSPLRVVSYGEVQAMAQRRGLLDERVAIAADQPSPARVWSSASPRTRRIRLSRPDIADALNSPARILFRWPRIWPKPGTKQRFSNPIPARCAISGINGSPGTIPSRYSPAARFASPKTSACSIIPRSWLT
jgi:hypothetical protein